MSTSKGKQISTIIDLSKVSTVSCSQEKRSKSEGSLIDRNYGRMLSARIQKDIISPRRVNELQQQNKEDNDKIERFISPPHERIRQRAYTNDCILRNCSPLRKLAAQNEEVLSPRKRCTTPIRDPLRA